MYTLKPLTTHKCLGPNLMFFFGACSSISYLPSLLDKGDKSVRIAAGEAFLWLLKLQL